MNDPRLPRTLIPRPRVPRKSTSNMRARMSRQIRKPLFTRHPWMPYAGSVAFLALFFFALPSILAIDLKDDYATRYERAFPVTVYPEEKVIVEDPAVEALLSEAPTTLTAAAGIADALYTWIAIRISDSSLYRQIAGAAGINNLFVTVRPGERAEEVAYDFGVKLGWTARERAEFLSVSRSLEPKLPDGQFVPGTYFVSVTSPTDVAALVHQRFESEILARYSTTTEAQVPLEDALTIASLLERESGGWDDMRIISGIVWNRLFRNMNLQIDATMQYSKATLAKGSGGWWPKPLPADKGIRSAYNTYRRAGLPPGPIANPSVAAVVAALNPKNTDCLFYFHDNFGRFHCSATYAEHVRLLKKYFGQGR